MDALKLLKEDHRRIRALLEEGEETTDRARVKRSEIFEKLSFELRVHERREEEVLYPALKKHAEAKAIVLEGYEEHHVADSILGELAGTEVTDERWAAKFKVLKESLEHHIEEEEGEMFSRARDAFDRDELESMGDQMASITTPD